MADAAPIDLAALLVDDGRSSQQGDHASSRTPRRGDGSSDDASNDGEGAEEVSSIDEDNRSSSDDSSWKDKEGALSAEAESASSEAALAAALFTAELQRRLDASGVLAVSGGSCGGVGFGDVGVVRVTNASLASCAVH
jgi:hypothetical protein